MTVGESRDLNGGNSKVAIGSPSINDRNIADLGRDQVSYLAIFWKNGRQLYVRIQQNWFFPDYLITSVLFINFDKLQVTGPKFVSKQLAGEE